METLRETLSSPETSPWRSKVLFSKQKVDVELWSSNGDLLSSKKDCSQEEFFAEVKQQPKGQYLLIFKVNNKVFKELRCNIKGGKEQ